MSLNLKDHLKTRTGITGGPAQDHYSSGLNGRLRCENENCEWYYEKVGLHWHQVGYDKEVDVDDRMPCYKCKQPASKPLDLVFNRCIARVKVEHTVEGKVRKFDRHSPTSKLDDSLSYDELPNIEEFKSKHSYSKLSFVAERPVTFEDCQRAKESATKEAEKARNQINHQKEHNSQEEQNLKSEGKEVRQIKHVIIIKSKREALSLKITRRKPNK